MQIFMEKKMNKFLDWVYDNIASKQIGWIILGAVVGFIIGVWIL